MGYADILGNKSPAASDGVLPLMVYITTKDTTLDQNLVDLFTKYKVLVAQAYVAYDANKKLYLTGTRILNPGLTAGKMAHQKPGSLNLTPPSKRFTLDWDLIKPFPKPK